jgi:hypothetical protein
VLCEWFVFVFERVLCKDSFMDPSMICDRCIIVFSHGILLARGMHWVSLGQGPRCGGFVVVGLGGLVFLVF